MDGGDTGVEDTLESAGTAKFVIVWTLSGVQW